MGSAVLCGQQRQRFAVGAQCALTLKCHERAKALFKVAAIGAWGRAAFEQFVRLDVKTLQLIDGQVDAATSGVFAYVTDDVGQLQRQTQLVGIGGGGVRALTKDAGGDFAHHPRHPVAIGLQLGKVQIAVLVQVHLATINDGLQ